MLVVTFRRPKSLREDEGIWLYTVLLTMNNFLNTHTHTHTHTHTQPAWNHRSSHSNQTPLGEWVVWELYHKIKQNRKFPQMIRKNSLCGKQSQKELLYFWTSGLWLLWPNFPLLLWVSLIFPPLFLQVSKDLEIVISLGGGTEKNPCFLSSLCKLKKKQKTARRNREGRAEKGRAPGCSVQGFDSGD